MATFQNQATLSYNGLSTTSNIAVGELLEELSVTKAAVYDRYEAGDTVAFVVSLVNAGTTDVTDVTVSDNLGQYAFGATDLVPLDYVPNTVRYYQNGVLQPTPAVVSGPPMQVSGLTVPAGGNAMVVYEAAVNNFAPLDVSGSVVNTASVSGVGIAAPIDATATILPDSRPQLTISKSLSPTTVTENGQITYTFVIQNSGNVATDAGDNVIVRDTFNPILDPIAVTIDGVGRNAGNDYTYAPATGVFETGPTAFTVPAATYTQDPTTGEWITNPGTTTITVTGTV